MTKDSVTFQQSETVLARSVLMSWMYGEGALGGSYLLVPMAENTDMGSGLEEISISWKLVQNVQQVQ